MIVVPFVAGLLGAQSPASLDSTVARVMAEQHVVGASVLVAKDGRILLHKGYGVADLGLDVPTKDETVYHVVGPMLPFTGVAVMQLVERGKISLDDDISKYIPEFPLQGRHVSVRQLLDHTSGIVDYHYLGDPIEATSRQPKALDEVMALYAGKKWVNEPGTKWDWSISGFQLLVSIIERVSGQTFADYARANLFEPASLTHTTYCDDYSLVRGLSHAYRRFENGFVPANENDMAYNADLRICSTVGDLYKLWGALAANKLLRAESFKLMQTATGAAARMSAADPKAQYGLALTINHEDDHRRYGQHGSLFGYSGSLYEFPRRPSHRRRPGQYRRAKRVCHNASVVAAGAWSGSAPAAARTGERNARARRRCRVAVRAACAERNIRARTGSRVVRAARLVRAIPPHGPSIR